MPRIETVRLHLRKFAPDDLDDFARLLADPSVMRYLGIEAGRPLSRAESESILNITIDAWAKYGYGRWAVVLRATGQLIGLCGFRAYGETPELMYLLAPAYWGQGYAYEAAHASLRYGFETLQSERIVAFTRPENAPSQRVLHKLGMRLEEEAEVFGVRARCYALTRAEFQPSDAFYRLTPD